MQSWGIQWKPPIVLSRFISGFPTSKAVTRARTLVKAKNIPDLVLVDKYGNAVGVVGEVKTPWKHKFRDALDSEVMTRHFFDSHLSENYRVKVLWHSNVIDYDTKSCSPSKSHNNDEDHFGTVSLRECFMYLGIQINKEEDRVQNKASKWVGDKPKDPHRTFGSNLYISHPDILPPYLQRDEDDKDARKPVSATPEPSRRSARLTNKTSHPATSKDNSGKQSNPTDGAIDVYTDNDTNRHYIEVDGEVIFVTLHGRHGEPAYVEFDSQRFAAVLVPSEENDNEEGRSKDKGKEKQRRK